jgi:hypothetical protein
MHSVTHLISPKSTKQDRMVVAVETTTLLTSPRGRWFLGGRMRWWLVYGLCAQAVVWMVFIYIHHDIHTLEAWTGLDG